MSWDLRKPAQLAARRRASLLLSHPEGVMLVRALLVGLGSASAYNMMPSRMAGTAPTQPQPRAAVAQVGEIAWFGLGLLGLGLG